MSPDNSDIDYSIVINSPTHIKYANLTKEESMLSYGFVNSYL